MNRITAVTILSAMASFAGSTDAAPTNMTDRRSTDYVDSIERAAKWSRAVRHALVRARLRTEAVASDRPTDAGRTIDELRSIERAALYYVRSVRRGRSQLLYFDRPDAGPVRCGDTVWLRNTADDQALVRAQTSFTAGNQPANPNLRIDCLDGAKGEPLTSRTRFRLTARVDRSNKESRHRRPATFRVRGPVGDVQLYAPFHLIANPRKPGGHGKIGGYCQSNRRSFDRLAFGERCQRFARASVISRPVDAVWAERFLRDVHARAQAGRRLLGQAAFGAHTSEHSAQK